jgi:hypothetical protein
VAASGIGEVDGTLVGERQVQTLFLDCQDAVSLTFLARMPNLRRLALSNWDPSKTGPLPAGTGKLESLVIVDSAIEDASPLDNVPENLQELSLVSCNGFADPAGLARFSQLHTLLLNLTPGVPDLSVLEGMKRLLWVGLPPRTSQAGLTRFVSSHPGLEYLEMVDCQDVVDLTPVAGLPGLKGLVVTSSSASLVPLKGLKSLTFLAAPGLAFDEQPGTIAELRMALPHAVIVATTNPCLGSGWLLVVLPLAAAMAFVRLRPWRRHLRSRG